jgi:SPP1 family predicted phage head-tail adaptor
MQIGRLNTRVTIQRPLRSPGPGGTQIDNGWEDIATVWANVRGLSGREYLMAQQAQSEVSHQVTIRYRSDVSPYHRLMVGGRELQIIAALDPDGRKTQLTLMCQEVVR